MKISRRTRIILTSIAAPLFFIVAFIVVVVLYNNFHQPTAITITNTGFTPQSIEITEGETLRFVNQSSILTQMLCVGTNQHCDNSPPLPQGLKNPVRIAPDQAKDVLFDAFGTFTIIDTAVPGKNLTVTVDAAD